MFFNTFKVDLDETESVKKLNLNFEFFGVAKPTIQAYINGKNVGISERKITGTIVVSEKDFPEFFRQGAVLEIYLSNNQTHQEIRTTVEKILFISKADLRNGVNPPPITYISDSDTNKSLMLPPVEKCIGKLYHFKYLGTQKPFRIVPKVKDESYPIQKSYIFPLGSYAPEHYFDSLIEGSYFIEMSVQNQCISLVSDGISWILVNNYEGTFTSVTKCELPEEVTFEKNKSHFLNYYWNNDASNNIVITDLRQHSLKFIHVHRFLPDTGFLNIYFPENVGVEQTDVSGQERACLSICLSNKALLSNTASFVLSYYKNRVYIISFFDGAGFKIFNYPVNDAVQLTNTLTIAGNNSFFKLPSIDPEKQETKFFIIKNKSQGRFILAAAEKDEPVIYTPKNGLRDCITYTKPLNKFCFWVIVYYDHQLEGQTSAVIINKYNHD